MELATLHGGPDDGSQIEAEEGCRLHVVCFPVVTDDMQPGQTYEGRFNVYDVRRASDGVLHGWFVGERTPHEGWRDRPSEA